VFAADSPATDIVVLGNFTITLVNGSVTRFDFTARFILTTGITEGETRFASVQVWTDNAPMQSALEKAKADDERDQK
jgi:hypothetical protein